MGTNEYTYRNGYRGTLEERMSSKTIKGNPNECWNWTGSLDTAGYACIRVNKKLCRASHVAFELSSGDKVPNGMIIMHSCDNPACVNPNHLSVGTPLLNSTDKINKGRGKWVKGEEHGMTKTTKKQVEEIRHLFSQGNHTYTSLALIYNVTRTTISNIVRKKTWK